MISSTICSNLARVSLILRCLGPAASAVTKGRLISVSTVLDNSIFADDIEVEDQPNFINCVSQIETNLSPHKLLKKLNSIEEKLGRVRHEKWGPRTIDLDIIFYNDLIINESDLIIPHPRAHLRRFVLEPICEIAPEFIHPGPDSSVLELLKLLEDNKKVIKREEQFTTSQQ